MPEAMRPGSPAPDLSFVVQPRSAGAFHEASRHSRLVRRLKLILPVTGGLLVLALVGGFVMAGVSVPSVDMGEVKVVEGRLVMNNPAITGLDNRQLPYKLTATRALQDAAHPTRVTLETIDAQVAVEAGNQARLRAGSGAYDAEARTLVLSDAIAVRTDDGMSLSLDHADVDIGAGRLEGHGRVRIDTGRAQLEASALSVSDNGQRIVFTGGVRMTVLPIGPDGAGGTPQAALRGPAAPRVGDAVQAVSAPVPDPVSAMVPATASVARSAEPSLAGAAQ